MELQFERVVLHQQAKTSGVSAQVWRARTTVQSPFHGSNIGQVGLGRQLFAGLDERRQFSAPLRQVAPLRRMGMPKGAGQSGQVVNANELNQDGEGGVQGPFCQQMSIGLIGF